MGKVGGVEVNKRARKKRTKRIVKATCFALAMATFSVAVYAMQLKEVNINYLGQSISFKTFASTVSDALKEQNISIGENQQISTDVSGKLNRSNLFSITEKPVMLAVVEPEVQHVVTQEIKEPEVKEVEKPVEVKKEENRNNSTKKNSSTTSRGTARTSWGPDVYQKEEGVLEASDGTLIEYEGVLQLEATAYCACYSCCGKYPGNKWYGITATGTKAKVGTIAVDPKVIPLGTKVYIEGLNGAKNYGYAVAEDTGGAIKGNIIDLYFNTHNETINWGRQQVNVYILKEGSQGTLAKAE